VEQQCCGSYPTSPIRLHGIMRVQYDDNQQIDAYVLHSLPYKHDTMLQRLNIHLKPAHVLRARQQLRATGQSLPDCSTSM
jgi:hypothetical protein